MVTASGAFVATNLDDIVILTLLFSSPDPQFRPFHVVSGQVLGFSGLLLVSLTPLLGRSLLPLPWLGLLGLLPISLGVSGLLERLQAQGSPAQEIPLSDLQSSLPPVSPAGGALAPVLAVAGLTAANGGDNIGVYLPLFAQASAPELVVILLTFGLALSLWCLLAWGLTRVQGLAQLLRRWGARLTPPLLIALGTLVLIDSDCLHDPALALIALVCLVVMTAPLLHLLGEAVDAASVLPSSSTDGQSS